MTLKEYLKDLNNLAEQTPEILDMEVVTSIDDEGNGFNRVSYTPCIGRYDSDDRDFTNKDNDEDPIGIDECNAVCLN